MQAVGLEGLFGLLSGGLGLGVVLLFGSGGGAGGEDGGYFNVWEGVQQIWGDRVIFWAGVGISVSIALFS